MGPIHIVAKMTGEIYKEDKKWISYCEPLDIYTCGHTKKEAIENTKEGLSRPLIIPKYDSIPTRIIKNILKTGRIDQQEYIDALKKRKIKK